MKSYASLAVALLTFLLSVPASASSTMRELDGVQSATVLDGAIACFRARDFVITATTGPCAGYQPPIAVRVGETFQANGRAIIINVIVASQALADFPELGLKAGQWICTAAESINDIPRAVEDGHTGTWLYIAHCQPNH